MRQAARDQKRNGPRLPAGTAAKRVVPARPPGRPGTFRLVVTTFAIIFVGGLIAALPTIIGAAGRFARELPSPENIGVQESFKTARILDRNGRLLYEIIDPNGGRRTVVPLSAIARPLQLATVAVEDATFYVNPGFDLRAIARAVWLNLRGQQILSGGSTITQQLVKNRLLSSEVSLTRKLKEAVLAMEVSRRYSKEQILEMYLNEVYYGNMAYGVEAAAQTYFGKPAKALDLAESALLAGLVQSPAEHDPYGDFSLAKERQGIVLDLMAKYDLISEQEAAAARAERIQLRRRAEAVAVPLRAPHFALYTRDLVEKNYGRDLLYHGGLEIRTTLDLDLQQAAEAAISEHLATIGSRNVTDAALVAIDPATGEILALAGSADFFDDRIAGQIDMALSRRQPGSTLKPFVYLTALGQSFTAASILQDVPTTFGGDYRPQNHDKKFRGPVSVRVALADSLNVPAVQVLQTVGVDAALATIHRMGITDLTDPRRYGLTLALGGGEAKLLDIVFAYTPFANKGQLVGEPVPDAQRKAGFREVSPAAILRITDSAGRTIYNFQPAAKQVADPRLAYLITSILADDEARAGTYSRHSYLELSRPAAAKTGTTDDSRDGWTIGYAPDLVAGVWVGNADNTPMQDVYGVSGAGYIWHEFMERALSGKPAREFIRPEGIVEQKICVETGRPPTAGCKQTRNELFAGQPVWTDIEPKANSATENTAMISSPAAAATVSGNVDVIGTAVAAAKTMSYSLHYASRAAPDKWTTIVAGRPFSVTNNLLGRWDTSNLAAGQYVLRLTVAGTSSTIALRTVTMASSGATPTAGSATPPTATPAATVTATRTPALTPTRARTVTPSPTPRRSPSPTPTTRSQQKTTATSSP